MKFTLSAIAVASLLIGQVESRWKPTPGLSWNYVLGDDKFELSKEKATVIDVDYNKSASEIKKYHDAGKKVICYFSGGTVEDWRDDYKEFEKVSGLIQNEYDDWPGEYWLDIRKSGLRPILKKRMKVAIEKNCDGIEVDNLDGYSVNKNHWDIKESDVVDFAKWLGNTAHELGISIGLKNIPGLIGKLESYFDFAINESCIEHSECGLYKPFLNNNKAVFGITYGDFNSKLNSLCKNLNGLNISMIVKKSQNLKQDGYTFNGKSNCGSSFSTGSAPVVKTTAVTSKKTTVKKTTTAVSKPTTVANKPTTVASKPTTVASKPSTVASNTNTNTNTNANVNANKPVVNNAVNPVVNNAVKPATNTAPAATDKSTSTAPVANDTKEETVANDDVPTVFEPENGTEQADPIVPDESSNPVESSTPGLSSNNVNNVVSDQFAEESEGGSTGTVVGVAVTGSVVGAAALVVLIKKNPKQYQQIKRSISRRATSIKRGASTVSRRLTNKKPKKVTLPLPTHNDSVENFNDNTYNVNSYKYTFTKNYDDFLN